MSTFYSDSGRGHPVVLIHGVGLSHAMWSAQQQGLSPHCRVIAYDMLGHGRSAPPSPGVMIDDFADQLLELLDKLAVERAAVVGFSMGALVARAFALRHPERLSSLALLNTVFQRDAGQRKAVLDRVADAVENGPGGNAGAAIERWFSADYRAAHPEEMQKLQAAMAANDPSAYAICYRLFATEDDYGAALLGEISARTLVATGELDVGSTPAMTLALAAHIPNARAVVAPGARHMMAVELAGMVNHMLLQHLEPDLASCTKEARA